MATKWTTETFKQRLYEIFGDKYDFSNVVYVNGRTYVSVMCPEHGMFEKQASSLLRGIGCPVCSKEQQRLNLEAKKKSPEYQSDYAKRATKRRQTMLDRYGVENPMELESTKQKIRTTCLGKYGVENPRQSEEVIEKARQTNLERYGAISYAQSEEGLKQIQDTMEERYGARNFMQSEAVKEKLPEMLIKSQQTQLQRYGATHYAKSEDFKNHFVERKEKEYQTKMKNGTWNTSVAEQELEQLLVEFFGRDDVKTQYKEDRYPFFCDFYIPSRDLFIELNACWTHGFHWYGSYPSDMNLLQEWVDKSTDYYDNAIDNWIKRDVQKRQCARDHGLNYIVFWRSDLQDALLWLASGAPDGQDWVREYSWIPEKNLEFDGHFGKRQWLGNIGLLVKKYQFDVLYAKELALWKENDIYKNHISFQMYLYMNRYKYLNKTPFELTSLEILRGMRIAGMVSGYTAFSVKGLEYLLQKYEIHSVFDPCAGWGERLLCCAKQRVKYIGVDINERLQKGYQQMISDLALRDSHVYCMDSSSQSCVDLLAQEDNFDMVFTCPPYWNQEVYSAQGAENLSYAEFLNWWLKVVQNCAGHSRYFCFQINQKYKQDMQEIVEQCGFVLVEEISLQKQASHFHRKDGKITKQEFESVLVFEQ